jgi:hypothetical protein
MSPPTNNWKQRRNYNRMHAEIETDITIRNSEKRHIIGQHKNNKKMSNTDHTIKLGVNSGAHEG